MPELALCRTHHREFDASEKLFRQLYKIDPVTLAKEFAAKSPALQRKERV